jgi:large subunit ribosomal protein L3
MAIGIFGKKIGMTQIFDPDGNVVPVTVLQVGPCHVLKIKKEDGLDGYNGLLLGLGEAKERSLSSPVRGSLKKLGAPPVRYIREVRLKVEEVAQFENKKVLTCDLFEVGEKVDVMGFTKGRGFQGVVKRHGFKGAPQAHGTHEYFRHPGSVGNRTWPGRIIKGKRMPGHYGNERMTVLGLRVVAVFPDKNIMMVKGAVPGPVSGLVFVRKTVKTKAPRRAATVTFD